MSELKKRKLKTYPGLETSAFMHPWDVTATDSLGKVPGLDTLVRKVMEYGLERVFYLENVADNVRVNEKMFPRLYRYLKWGCKILDVPEPEMYVTMQYDFRAFTYGHTRPFMVLSSGLLDALDEEERFFVIAHELGHIKCDHVLYTVVAENIAALLEMVGRATLGIGQLLGSGLALGLYDWYRKAELSADRAALLCVQDPSVAMRTFMKMAGGTSSLLDEMDPDAFMEQIRAYEDPDQTGLDKAYKVLLTAFRTHPFPIMRAKYLDEWIREGGFSQLSGVDVSA
jgi:Zn-dependent protease with chaperone function